MEDNQAPLGAVLRQRRQQLGMSLTQLAQQTGIHKSLIGRIEQGLVAQPAPDKLTRLAEALQLNPADVFAVAGYTTPRQLPTLRPYLRAKYGNLPEQAVREVERYLARLQTDYGRLGTPIDGEDELPES